MALPKINDVPKYDFVIPSTKQTIKYRPFLVKEQKILLMAMETQDQSQILNAITDTIKSCVLSDVDFNRLTSFDVEYMFTQIRAKSVGERSNILLTCEECEASTAVVVDLEKIVVDVPKSIPNIKLTDKYTLKLRYPKYQAVLQNEAMMDTESAIEAMYQTIISCLDSLQSQDENIRFDDEPREEISRFLETLTTQQFDDISSFVQNLPKLTHTVEFDCVHCNHHNVVTLQGIRDFF